MSVDIRKEWAIDLQRKHDISIAMSCGVVQISRTAYYYQHKRKDDSEIVTELNKITDKHSRWGFMKCFNTLRKKGFLWNHKRVHRVYVEHRFQLTAKKKQRYPKRHPDKLVTPKRFGECWSIDFMSDSLDNRIRFRTFNVIDDYNREALGIDIGIGLPSASVIRYLDRLADIYGYPDKIRCDNGSEFTSHYFKAWADKHEIRIDYIEPGSPYQNGFIERFNRTYREEVLDQYLFKNLTEVQNLTADWLAQYNDERPHESLGQMTPSEYRTNNNVYF